MAERCFSFLLHIRITWGRILRHTNTQAPVSEILTLLGCSNGWTTGIFTGDSHVLWGQASLFLLLPEGELRYSVETT